MAPRMKINDILSTFPAMCARDVSSVCTLLRMDSGHTARPAKPRLACADDFACCAAIVAPGVSSEAFKKSNDVITRAVELDQLHFDRHSYFIDFIDLQRDPYNPPVNPKTLTN